MTVRLESAKVGIVRRWTVYECPIHGVLDQIHTRMDRRCPVQTKGKMCPHELEGPILVEEILHHDGQPPE